MAEDTKMLITPVLEFGTEVLVGEIVEVADHVIENEGWHVGSGIPQYVAGGSIVFRRDGSRTGIRTDRLREDLRDEIDGSAPTDWIELPLKRETWRPK